MRIQDCGKKICTRKFAVPFRWPWLISKFMPLTFYFFYWASQHGAIIHPSCRLCIDSQFPEKGLALTLIQPVQKGEILMAIPESLVFSASSSSESIVSPNSMIEKNVRSAYSIARVLNEPNHMFFPYFTFLSEFSSSRILEKRKLLSSSLNFEGEDFGKTRKSRRKGLKNAPFLERADFESTYYQVELYRLQREMRNLAQTLPYFATSCVSWAISVMFSRGNSDITVADDSISLIPLIDLSNHSFDPNAIILKLSSSQLHHLKNPNIVSKEMSPQLSYIVLLASSYIEKKKEITVSYRSQKSSTLEERDLWKFYWGFIPNL